MPKSTPNEPGDAERAEGKAQRRPQIRLVAALQDSGVVPNARLPAVLRGVQHSDEAAYHEAGTFRGKCDELRTHFHFIISPPKWIIERQGRIVANRLFSPGTRLIMDDGQHRYAVRLTDNYQTLRSSCPEISPASWTFSALYLPRPADPQDAASENDRPQRTESKQIDSKKIATKKAP